MEGGGGTALPSASARWLGRGPSPRGTWLWVSYSIRASLLARATASHGSDDSLITRPQQTHLTLPPPRIPSPPPPPSLRQPVPDQRLQDGEVELGGDEGER